MAEADRDATAELNNVRAANSRREKNLLAQGVKLGDDSVVQLTVQVLKAMVVGDDPDRQAEFDLRYQHHLASALTEVENAVARSKLTAPPPGGKVLRLPGHG